MSYKIKLNIIDSIGSRNSKQELLEVVNELKYDKLFSDVQKTSVTIFQIDNNTISYKINSNHFESILWTLISYSRYYPLLEFYLSISDENNIFIVDEDDLLLEDALIINGQIATEPINIEELTTEEKLSSETEFVDDL